MRQGMIAFALGLALLGAPADAQDQSGTPAPAASQPAPPQPAGTSTQPDTTNPAPAAPEEAQPVSPLLKDSVRLSPVPAVSMLVPKDWFACIPADSKLLGDHDRPSWITEKFCDYSDTSVLSFRLADRTSGQRLLVTAHLADDPTATPQYLQGASPSALAAFSKEFCDTTTQKTDNLTVSSCKIAPTTVDGRAAFAGTVIMTYLATSIPSITRTIWIPLKGQFLQLMFEAVEADTANTDPVVDAIVASIKLSDAPPPDGLFVLPSPDPVTPLKDSTQVPLVSGISMSVPKGWMSCEDKMNRLLGNDSLPRTISDRFCSRLPDLGDAIVYLFYPADITQMFATVSLQDAPGLTPEIFKSFARRDPEKTFKGLCRFYNDPTPSIPPSCHFSYSPIGKRIAFAGTVSKANMVGPFATTARVMIIPMKGAIVRVEVADTDMEPATTGPIVDAMLASIAMQ